MTKQTILTGIRANNDLHIGNYFGAMLPMIDMVFTDLPYTESPYKARQNSLSFTYFKQIKY